MSKLRRSALVPLALACAVLAGCEDITGSVAEATVSLSLTAASPTPQTLAAAAALVPIQDAGGRVLDVQEVQFVLRDVEIERQFDLPGCADGEDDACEKFEAGPVLIDLPLDGAVITPFDVPIPAGTYDELELRIKKPEDDSTSSAFFAAHPSWPRKASLRVVGTFDANDGAGPQAFDIFLEVDAKMELALVPPFVVSDSADVDLNVTLAIDVGSWFVRETGSLVDPRGAGLDGEVADVVEDNMERSFEAFEDDDRDGSRDDNSGSSDDDGTPDQGSGDR